MAGLHRRSASSIAHSHPSIITAISTCVGRFRKTRGSRRLSGKLTCQHPGITIFLEGSFRQVGDDLNKTRPRTARVNPRRLGFGSDGEAAPRNTQPHHAAARMPCDHHMCSAWRAVYAAHAACAVHGTYRLIRATYGCRCACNICSSALSIMVSPHAPALERPPGIGIGLPHALQHRLPLKATEQQERTTSTCAHRSEQRAHAHT